MRIAALYDIHGNLPALEVVLDQVNRSGVDQIVIGGDIAPGPFPREILEILLKLQIPTRFIQGNCEVAMLQQVAGEEITMVPPPVRPIIEWSVRQFMENQLQFIKTWPKTLQVNLGSVDVLFCHGTPRDENEVYAPLTIPARLLHNLSGVDANVVVSGHTHMQSDRTN